VSVPAASLAFSAHAPQYTALRRRLVPGYDRFYGAAVDALRPLAEGGNGIRRVLDLGAGTGLMTAHVAQAFPQARFELLDGSQVMLDEASQRLGDLVSAVHVADMKGQLPFGPFDAVVSALAIHHLEDSGKEELYRRVLAVLRPGGIFVNAEQVAGPTAELTELYDSRWLQDCLALGASETEVAEAIERRRHDRCAPVEAQLRWLRDAGFAWADCFYKEWGFAVLCARRGGRR
jgi:tRNA (cmo5U34)-methyltransferase